MGNTVGALFGIQVGCSVDDRGGIFVCVLDDVLVGVAGG